MKAKKTKEPTKPIEAAKPIESPKSMEPSPNMSAADIRQQLAALESQQAELEKVLVERRKEERKGFVDDIRQRIVDAGYDLQEITAKLVTRKYQSHTRSDDAHDTREYPYYFDPDNPEHRYTRGVLPVWMKDKMRGQGLDPADKSHRDRFKSESLHRAS
ncbi:DNA-binding protein H-NS [Gammaproteobacteria bacterium]